MAFVQWCRHLSRVAGQVATQVEDMAQAASVPRHYADEQPEQDGGTQEGDQGW
jgi:hypothetical protein